MLNSRRNHATVRPDSGAGVSFAGVLTGDPQAFEALFRAYVEPLCAFVYTYVERQDVAQEIVQDLFCWLWVHRHSLPAMGSVRAYLYSAARNRAINHIRDSRVELQFEATAAGDRHGTPGTCSTHTPSAEAEAADLAEALSRALRAMPPRCREVFTLTRDQQLSHAEVAQVLGISIKTVEIHMGRALALLRERLAPWLQA
jgi:RNA polymerase sigma-70 factor, ECF subfamily